MKQSATPLSLGTYRLSSLLLRDAIPSIADTFAAILAAVLLYVQIRKLRRCSVGEHSI